MIIDKTVEVRWQSKNKVHFECKGYKFTKYGDAIVVDINDLAITSSCPVNVKCDYCGKVFTKGYKDYCRGKNTGNGKDCCKECISIKTQEGLMSKYGVNCIFKVLGTAQKIGEEKRTDSNLVLSEFYRQGIIPIDFHYVNCNNQIKFICPKHISYGVQTTNYGSMKNSVHSCRACQGEAERLDRHPSWKGGISPLENFFKRRIKPWRKESIKACNGMCVVSGKCSNIVHHLYGFSNILKETMDELSMPIKSHITEYTADEISTIGEKLLENHFKYPLGVCLTLDIHHLFHHIYGYGNNTPEQFYEFKKRYASGEFKEAI